MMTFFKFFSPNNPLLLLLITGFLFTACNKTETNTRSRENFNGGWKFKLGDLQGAHEPAFDDSGWRSLTLPHDWSIEGEFSMDNPATPGGGALPGGVGWYRKTFRTTEEMTGKHAFIEFDGVYRNSEVWMNGNHLGTRPYGYSSFEYEITDFLKPAGDENLIAVKADNSKQPNSRWYSGSGIYRNVWLTVKNGIHIDHWGTFISTPEITEKAAKVRLIVNIKNDTPLDQVLKVSARIANPGGQDIGRVQSGEISVSAGEQFRDTLYLDVKDPMLWSVENPYLYSAIFNLETGGNTVDREETIFGIRYYDFDAEKGFTLNGKPLKILGVCNHHDLGCLGAAVNPRAIERQLEILKKMGCNAIRTSHNPPAPELLDLCDRMGFLVMDEAFDMWKMEKTEFDYHLDWDAWHKRDLEDMVLRDRNHPSVIIWSIGNEIREQRDSTGIAIANELTAIVKNLDDARPVISGLDHASPENYIYRSGSLDLVGFNYRHHLFADFPKNFPGQKFIASESTSALATRGNYDMPSDSIRIWPVNWQAGISGGNPDFTCSAYDNCRVPWGSTHEDTWKVVKKYDFISGLFIWTGFDYLGEPTPYSWPARSSYFGIVDLAGFPKDAYYLYQSEWTKNPVLHIFPHWNWKGGDIIDVWAYTNLQTAELFLNGKSLGIKTKGADDLHLVWRVPYEPGKIVAIGYSGGKEMMRSEIKTAGSPAKIILEADRKKISANGFDLSFISVGIADSAGVVIPDASNLVKFHVSGNGFIAGVDNGNPVSHESFKASYRKAFNGLCLAVIQSTDRPGSIRLEAVSENLDPASIEIISEK